MAHPQAGIDYPGTWSQFLEWFADEASCIAFLERLRWPNGFVCPKCDSPKGWRIADGRWSCQGCARKVSVTANTIFDTTRTPLRIWFAAAWYLTNQKYGASALGLQRVLGFGSYQTAWAMLHKLRSAMVRPERSRLAGRVEVDETLVGGVDRGRKRGRGAGRKSLVAIAVEVLSPNGFGRIRMQIIPDASGASLMPFACQTIEPGSEVMTDGWWGYRDLPLNGYTRSITILSESPDPAHVSMPAVHRVASLLKRWLMGTHQGSARPIHLQAYLEEFTFRFNRRSSRQRGLLFFRLLEQAVLTPPTPYHTIVRQK